MGVDSTALLLRWLDEPSCRNFDLADLTVLTAMTGDEFPDTKRLVETHILHRLRASRVRFVQVARAGIIEADGIRVLDDSPKPERLHIEGAYKLSEELTSIGTVPQVATGQRRCTHHFKGFPLTAWIDRTFGSWPIRQVIGYNADETKRVERGEGYSTGTRPLEFPLVEWEWGREECERAVLRIVGETWRKSCCVFCPFAAGKPDILVRYRQFPEDAAEALFLEHISLAFNPNMTLYASRSLLSVLERDGNTEALRLFRQRLDACPWAVYRVRRIVWAKGRADRSVIRLFNGTRREASEHLGTMGDAAGGRTVLLARGSEYPTREEMVVTAPAVVGDKERPRFAENWRRMVRESIDHGDLPTDRE